MIALSPGLLFLLFFGLDCIRSEATNVEETEKFALRKKNNVEDADTGMLPQWWGFMAPTARPTAETNTVPVTPTGRPLVFYSADLSATQEFDSRPISIATGRAFFTLYPNGVMLGNFIWDLQDSDFLFDEFVGIHIRVGDSATNGPILYGFCGADPPLPPLSVFGITPQACPQLASESMGRGLTASVCDFASPSCYNDGDNTRLSAYDFMLTNPNVYVSYHTMLSYVLTNGLGLIRGQLMVQAACTDCPNLEDFDRERQRVNDVMRFPDLSPDERNDLDRYF